MEGEREILWICPMSDHDGLSGSRGLMQNEPKCLKSEADLNDL